ncbi:hypothetical protein GobsT_51910 [Gemmata obscuriglobus]|uniref:FtsH ternary system domain-containing protein n=1 Tax=Gemmata obscuriglobus TaxID=114 RepID=A0A2Z3H5N1_9BACT|nr:hypothetical protein [Gemmata obscuriglobus]AWM36934.1 hypothetical protein C1280_07805 [Gemmata obscuriglobus]QEG30386.1 hypothetical protein GobsT_51910 [Gemmata obscuriglobus]VTS09710.1 Uncharacterized protein OS=Myxococcus sp. (contaminant ex DSM 436) GN=A176_07118 PE=4 SV=1 [Gemmata obscuriglobus UQM 2246]
MPALFFPNPDALRLALASGLVPSCVTGVPGRAGRDDTGRIWVELDQLPPRDVLAAIGRFGVVAVGSPGAPAEPIRCWAELLPLRKSAPAPGPVLFSIPDKQLAAFVARLRRLRAGPLGIRLLSEPHAGRAWVTAPTPPAAVLLWTEEPDTAVRAFRQQAPGVWTARGWEHPLAGHLPLPPSCVLLCEPAGIVLYREPVPTAADDEYPLHRRPNAAVEAPAPAAIEVQLRLRGTEPAGAESLWVLSPPELGAFGDFCRSADERLLRRFQIATLEAGGRERIVIRHTPSDDSPGLPLAVPGYQCDPRLPGLFVPVGRALRPITRASEVGRELGLRADRLTWLEPSREGAFTINSAALELFRPLCDQLEYVPPAATILVADRINADVFALDRFALRVEPVTEPEPDVLERVIEEPSVPTDAPPGWVAKSVGRIVRWVSGRAARSTGPTEPGARPELAAGQKRTLTAAPTVTRVEQKLSSADALLHGHDRAAHRHRLESRLLSDFSTLEPDQRAARWAELANVYGATGRALDAAVCWVNAIWECPVPPPEWLEEWAAAERAAAKPGDRAAELERWLAEPGRPGTGRVVASLAACAGWAAVPPAGFASDLPRVLAVLDQHFEDIPVRGAWLARLAVARATNGDVLGLARWRDRIIHRLHHRGPGLDLDEPSFLRFRGAATAERFKTAREWLTHQKEPILKWVQRHAGGARLEWTGLEAETEATAVYAQFMLAWGLGALGERAPARDWAARARKALSRAGGPRADPAAHALLGDLFLHRIKDAHEGAAPKAALPAEFQERLDRLHEFARYSVDRLREHSRILQPLGQVSAYHGRDLKEFWGPDRLGERLALLGSQTDPAYVNEEARALIALIASQPTTATVPRVVFALLEAGATLEHPQLSALIERVPAALDWLEAWVRGGRWTDAERPQRVSRYQARIIGSALALAPVGPLASVVLQHVTRGAAAGPLLPAATAAAPRVFRAARKFGLAAEAEALMSVLDPARAGWLDQTPTVEKVGLAVGWFAAGDEEAGIRILDAARKYLFELASPDPAARTAVALAYAEALGFAPAGIALGRLEELFQRLDRVTVSGSTNCYFTLQPLRLIDAVVRSVVTDEFTLGTAVRAWLDEDEFLIRRRVHRDMTTHLRESGHV